MAEHYSEENSDWTYDSFTDGFTSQYLREEAMGQELVMRRKEEQRAALDMLYDVRNMSNDQLQTLAVLRDAGALSSDEMEAIERSICKLDAESFDKITIQYDIESYIEQHQNRVPLFGRFIKQIASGIPLTENQINAARSQMRFEQDPKDNVA